MAKTLLEAINLRQKTYKNKQILYLDTVFTSGMYQGKVVKDVLKFNPGYIEFCIKMGNFYIADELSIEFNK